MFWKKKKHRPTRRFQRLQQTLSLPMPWLTCQDEQGAAVEGEIVDVSEAGLCLRMTTEVKPGSIFTLIFKDKELRLEVKWCRFVKADDAFQCGLELMHGQSGLLDELAKVWSIGD